jgi:hypothetical protein
MLVSSNWLPCVDSTVAGLEAKIMEGYQWLCETFGDSPSKCEIALVGFSRGAHTVRIIACLIEDMGLLKPGPLSKLNELFEIWRNHREGKDNATRKWAQLKASLARQSDIHRDVEIRVCAVWDTVGTMGTHKPFAEPTDKQPFGWARTYLPRNIRNAFQALAIDEDRKLFTPNIWRRTLANDAGQRLVQCWFRGTHSDVGGGANVSFANISLIWMVAQLDGLLPIDARSMQATLEAGLHYHITSEHNWCWNLNKHEKKARHLDFTTQSLMSQSIHASVASIASYRSTKAGRRFLPKIGRHNRQTIGFSALVAMLETDGPTSAGEEILTSLNAKEVFYLSRMRALADRNMKNDEYNKTSQRVQEVLDEIIGRYDLSHAAPASTSNSEIDEDDDDETDEDDDAETDEDDDAAYYDAEEETDEDDDEETDKDDDEETDEDDDAAYYDA